MKRFALALLLPAALALPAAAQETIRVGQTVSGTLGSGDPTLDDGSYYRLYRVQLRDGQRVTVTLRSDDFDAYLAVGRFDDTECDEDCETDDDGGGGTDSRIVYTARQSGTHTIRVNTLTEGESGGYTLRVEDAGAAPDPGSGVRGSIDVGESVSGTLGVDDPTAGDGSFYEMWTFHAATDGRVRIVLESQDFDAYLGFGRGTPEEWEEMESDDDSAGGTDAALEIRVEAGRAYLIRANSLSRGETGRYTLRIERM